MERCEADSPGAWMNDTQATSSWLGDYRFKDGVRDRDLYVSAYRTLP